MPRLMSVRYTEAAVRDRRKTVTRRAGWSTLQPGTQLDLCRQVMGRKPGDPLVRIARVRVLDVRREPLNAITDDDVDREGFGPYGDPHPHQDWWPPGTVPPAPVHGEASRRFVGFFIDHMGGTPDQLVTRIGWEYLRGPCAQCGYGFEQHHPETGAHAWEPM